MSTTTERRNSTVRYDVTEFTQYHWLVVALAVISGVVHLYLYATESYLPFLLAGLGFFGAVVLLVVLPDYRRYLYPVGVLFVLAQLAGYLLMHTSFQTPLWLDVVDKVAQVLLVVVLSWFTYRDWG